MRFIPFCITLMLIYFISVSCVNSADRETADELYVKSGLEKQMRDIGPALLAGYKNNYSRSGKHTDRDKRINQNIKQVTGDSFDIEGMRETVVAGLMEGISDSDMERILAWLESPVGKKITELEERAGSEKGMKETGKYIKNIKNASISPERIRLIKDLDSSMNITDTTVDISLSTQFALSMTTEKSRKRLSRDDVGKLYEDFQKNRGRVEPMLRDQVHGSLLYTYQELSDEDLGKFLAFAQSETGKKYNSVTTSIILKVITDSSLQFAWGISQL